MIERGADEVWLAVGSGAKGYGVFNAIVSDLALRAGDLIWVDGGAYHRGYMCDFIRSAVIGEPSADQSRWYTAALESNRAALRRCPASSPASSSAPRSRGSRRTGWGRPGAWTSSATASGSRSTSCPR